MKGLLSLVLLVCSATVAADALVWEVERDGNKVILAGTIHMLKPGDYPLAGEYRRALSEADTVVFETDMQAVESPEFSQKMAQKMRLPAGQNLSTVLSPEVYEQLRAFASERDMPLGVLGNYQPAFIGLTLWVMEMQKLGFSEGVDGRYTRLATEQGKDIGALETPEEQLDYIAAMTELDPDDFIRYTLEDLKQLRQASDDMVAAFKSGDDKALYRLSAEPMIDYSPKLYRTLLTDRNRRWLEDIEQYLQTPETELVMVGALHLAGPDSVQAMLRAKGYTVERY